MESEAVLRKLLLVAFLSVVSTGMPSYAVDYIACREMLRTKNEFIDISSQYETGKIKTQEIYNTKKDKSDRDKCYMREVLSQSNSLDEALKAFDLAGECLQKKEKGKDKRRLYFLTDEGHYYYKKALKVEADMRKANCPY